MYKHRATLAPWIAASICMLACEPEGRRLHWREPMIAVVDPPLRERRIEVLAQLRPTDSLSANSLRWLASSAAYDEAAQHRLAQVRFVRENTPVGSQDAIQFFGERLRWDPDPEVRRESLEAACGSNVELEEQVRSCATDVACAPVARCLAAYGARSFSWLSNWVARSPGLRRLAADVVCAFVMGHLDPGRSAPRDDAGPWLADALAILDAEGAGDRAECMHDLLALSKIDAIPATPCAETP